MDVYVPSDDFTDKVMIQVRKMEARRQRQLLLVERLLGALPVRTLMSVVALLGGVWNLLRIYMMLSPAICK
jgi:hypothetical protein